MGYRRAGLGIMNVSSKNNDIMSSYENKSGTNARWYHDADGKGRCVTMLAYRSDNDINTWDDDELTSWSVITLLDQPRFHRILFISALDVAAQPVGR